MEPPNEHSLKCHKCRHVLIKDITNGRLHKIPCDGSKCPTYNEKNFIHLAEDNLPDWIQIKVEEEQWTKGKLYCEKCKSKVGSFDFVSGRKCDCGDSLLPNVHFVSSQIDRPFSLNSVLGLT